MLRMEKMALAGSCIPSHRTNGHCQSPTQSVSQCVSGRADRTVQTADWTLSQVSQCQRPDKPDSPDTKISVYRYNYNTQDTFNNGITVKNSDEDFSSGNNDI